MTDSNAHPDAPRPIDTFVDAWYVVTMNETRDIIHRGSIAIHDGAIVEVGKTADLERRYAPAQRLGGDRFVAAPGMVNTHIHITGEPLTRGYVPDDTPFEENVFVWLTNLYAAYAEGDERCSAQLAATEMLRSGTTTFLEAGTVRLLDEVFDGLAETGIRGRLGAWVEPATSYTRWALPLSFGLPLLGLLVAAIVRFRHRGHILALMVVGLLVGIGAHPYDAPS